VANRFPKLPNYEILRELGRGAMGVVYLARHLSLDRHVAIKRLRVGASLNQVIAMRFMREGRVLADLDHPNIVRVYDLLEVNDELYLVLEYVAGPTLRRILMERRLSSSLSLLVLEQLCSASAFISARGVVHRDIKPENVLVNGAGICKLTDYGIARILYGNSADDRGFRTQTGELLGTPAYLSPEAARGDTGLDHRADLYSLGILAYELFVGSPPFAYSGNLVELLDKQIFAPVPRPSERIDAFPQNVEVVLLRALEKDPSDRQSDAGEFWWQLERAAEVSWPDWRRDADLAALVTQVEAPSEMAQSVETVVVPRPANVDEVRLPDHPASPERSGKATIARSPGALDNTIQRDAENRAPMSSRSSDSIPPKVSVPVYEPATKSRVPTLRSLVLVGAIIVVIGLTAVLVTRRSLPQRPLGVRSLSVQVSPRGGAGTCPSATYLFTGRITTNDGAGRLQFRWRRPDGIEGPVMTTSVPEGQRIVIESLRFTFNGSGSASGVGTLSISRPNHLSSSAVVSYTCP